LKLDIYRDKKMAYENSANDYITSRNQSAKARNVKSGFEGWQTGWEDVDEDEVKDFVVKDGRGHLRYVEGYSVHPRNQKLEGLQSQYFSQNPSITQRRQKTFSSFNRENRLSGNARTLNDYYTEILDGVLVYLHQDDLRKDSPMLYNQLKMKLYKMYIVKSLILAREVPPDGNEDEIYDMYKKAVKRKDDKQAIEAEIKSLKVDDVVESMAQQLAVGVRAPTTYAGLTLQPAATLLESIQKAIIKKFAGN
jgi:hypothetical protein